MFRVVSYQAVLRILFVSAGLVLGAVAQDQPEQKSADKPAQAQPAAPPSGVRAGKARARCRRSPEAAH